MSDLHEDLESWLNNQSGWLQLAAERWLASGSLSDLDVDDCVKELKTSESKPGEKRSYLFLGAAPSSHTQGALRLNSIGSIVGIENLGPRRPLEFGNGNLCVIYGHNGSGKSSYTRLLKKVCGKPRAKDLRPNVFLPLPPERHCEISYSASGTTESKVWKVEDAPLAELRAVDLFDSDEAAAYLTSETSVTYTPPAVALLEALAGVCDRVRSCLQSEQDLLVRNQPTLPAEYRSTTIGAAWSKLSTDTDAATVRKLSTWTTEDEEAHTRLAERLKVQDPAAFALAKRNARLQITQILSGITGLVAALGEDRLKTLRSLRDDAMNTRRIATESANIKRAELDGIGTDTWRALWMAARDYSQVAYPMQSFPVTEDARCVLCHQQLDAAAQERLHDFESFVQSTLETAAREAELKYKQAIEEPPLVWTSSQANTICQAAHLNDPDIVQQVANFFEEATNLRETLISDESAGPAKAIEPPTTLLEYLRSREGELEAAADQHEADAAEFDRPGATVEKLELEARRWTSQQSASIQPELERLRKVGTYENWKRLAGSRGISTKSTEVAEKAITEAYVERFNAELKKLGATSIQVQLIKSRTTKGQVLHKIGLRNTSHPKVVPDDVLSEGERRIITLAAFLADVVDKPYAAPFIFDDPISSLDHEYEWAVAMRLAELAKDRQVLVFTHRLSLFGAMEDAAKKISKASPIQLFIEKFDGVAGQPADQEAFAANTKTANNILISRLNDAKKAGETAGPVAYRQLAQGICCDFRKLLERTIEDDLLNQIVRRHRRSVQTDNKLSVLARISEDDCSFFDDLMTRYSCFEHSQSSETPIVIPEFNNLLCDFEDLQNWRKNFKKLQTA